MSAEERAIALHDLLLTVPYRERVEAIRAAEAAAYARAAQEVRAIEEEVEDGESVANLCDELERRIRALAGTGAPGLPLIEDHPFTPHTYWKKDVCDARFVEGERSRVCARTRKEHAR